MVYDSECLLCDFQRGDLFKFHEDQENLRVVFELNHVLDSSMLR